jgi:hypothetical protein
MPDADDDDEDDAKAVATRASAIKVNIINYIERVSGERRRFLFTSTFNAILVEHALLWLHGDKKPDRRFDQHAPNINKTHSTQINAHQSFCSGGWRWRGESESLKPVTLVFHAGSESLGRSTKNYIKVVKVLFTHINILNDDCS